MFFFFFIDTFTSVIYTLSLHDALPIFAFNKYIIIQTGYDTSVMLYGRSSLVLTGIHGTKQFRIDAVKYSIEYRSEEHTSELQSLRHLVCRLLLEKKKIETNERQNVCHR